MAFDKFCFLDFQACICIDNKNYERFRQSALHSLVRELQVLYGGQSMGQGVRRCETVWDVRKKDAEKLYGILNALTFAKLAKYKFTMDYLARSIGVTLDHGWAKPRIAQPFNYSHNPREVAKSIFPPLGKPKALRKEIATYERLQCWIKTQHRIAYGGLPLICKDQNIGVGCYCTANQNRNRLRHDSGWMLANSKVGWEIMESE